MARSISLRCSSLMPFVIPPGMEDPAYRLENFVKPALQRIDALSDADLARLHDDLRWSVERADLLADPGHRVLNERAGGPGRRAAADAEEEVGDQLLARWNGLTNQIEVPALSYGIYISGQLHYLAAVVVA